MSELTAEMAALLEKLCLDELSSEEADRIEAIIRENDDLCRQYIIFMQMHALAERINGVDAECEAKLLEHPAPAQTTSPKDFSESHAPPTVVTYPQNIAGGYFTSGWPLAYTISAALVGIGLLIGSFVYISPPRQIADHKGPPISRQMPVAGITALVDCVFSNAAAAPFVGSHVPPGRKYAIASGLMEITYNSGAKVVLQGPCEYEITSADAGYLAAGKLAAQVEKSAENHKSLSTLHSPLFTVSTPSATVTDLGTEFGIEVDNLGRTNTHLFRGVVEVRVTADGHKPGKTIRLTENESVSIETINGQAETFLRKADPTAFVRVEQLPKLAEEQRLKSFRLWQSQSERIRGDASLLAYYDFQRRDDAPEVLCNSAGTGRACDGAIRINPPTAWAAGHIQGKHAVSFQNPTDHVRVVVPQATDNLTLMARVYTASIDHASAGLLMSEKPPADYATAVLADNPAAYWRLDETKGKFHSAAGSEHAGDDWFGSDKAKNTLSRGQEGPAEPQFPGFGPANKGIALANKSGAAPTGFVSIGSSAGLQPEAGDWSVEAWVFTNTDYAKAKSEGYVICGKDGYRNGFGLEINSSGFVCLSFAEPNRGAGYAKEVVNLGSNSILSLGKWHHIVGTMQRNATATQDRFALFIDGAQVNQLLSDALFGERLTPGAAPIIGAMNSAMFGFNGSIDEVALYKHALTGRQVASHYAAARIAPKPAATSDARRIHWQITPEGSLCFDANGETHRSDPVIIDKNLGRWIDVATVYDGAAGRVRFYLDGRGIGETKITNPGAISIGPAWIGQWMPGVSEGVGKNAFRGRIDEMAVFGRALSDEELRQFHNEKPKNKTNTP